MTSGKFPRLFGPSLSHPCKGRSERGGPGKPCKSTIVHSGKAVPPTSSASSCGHDRGSEPLNRDPLHPWDLSFAFLAIGLRWPRPSPPFWDIPSGPEPALLSGSAGPHPRALHESRHTSPPLPRPGIGSKSSDGTTFGSRRWISKIIRVWVQQQLSLPEDGACSPCSFCLSRSLAFSILLLGHEHLSAPFLSSSCPNLLPPLMSLGPSVDPRHCVWVHSLPLCSPVSSPPGLK